MTDEYILFGCDKQIFNKYGTTYYMIAVFKKSKLISTSYLRLYSWHRTAPLALMYCMYCTSTSIAMNKSICICFAKCDHYIQIVDRFNAERSKKKMIYHVCFIFLLIGAYFNLEKNKNETICHLLWEVKINKNITHHIYKLSGK